MKFEDVKKLHQKRYREEFGYFLVEGEHPVLELQKAALQNPQLQDCELYVTRGREHWRSPFETHVISEAQMAQIADTKTPQGIVALVPVLRPPPVCGDEQMIYLYEIQDPGNLGTILRTLAWFGKLRCLLSPGSVDPYNSKVVRASAGAIFHVPIELDVELLSLRERFERVACLDMKGESCVIRRFSNVQLLPVRQRSPRPAPRAARRAQRKAVCNCRWRHHRITESGIGRQHVRV